MSVAPRFELFQRRLHLSVRGRVASGQADVIARPLTEALLEHGDLEALHVAFERRHVVLGLHGRRLTRIETIDTGDRGQQAGEVFHGPGHRAAMIERHLDRYDAGIGHEAVGRLKAIGAAPGGRNADRATLIAAKRHVDIAIGNEHARAIRGRTW